MQNNNSQNANNILSRLKTALKIETDTALASFLGVSNTTISTWKSRNSIDFRLIFAKCEQLDYDWLIKGDEHSEALPLKQTKSSKTKEGIPLIPVAVMAGFRNGDSQVMDYEIEDNYVVPEFLGKGVKFLIRASGSSMQPKYSNGDILACRPITDLTFFQWGKVYVLDTDQGSVVKRLFPCAEDADAIECHSDNNANYPSFKINKSSIRNISIVVGVIRLE